MADGKSPTPTLPKSIAVWLLSLLLVGSAAVVVWWLASDIVVAIIHAFEIIIWLLGLMLWPFRL
ncbi:MAG: hypothetical protein QNJ62_11920 [Methyloceanibacter sp.]|nr:hypothetical protein [Methyloceanibacter sp.]